MPFFGGGNINLPIRRFLKFVIAVVIFFEIFNFFINFRLPIFTLKTSYYFSNFTFSLEHN